MFPEESFSDMQASNAAAHSLKGARQNQKVEVAFERHEGVECVAGDVGPALARQLLELFDVPLLLRDPLFEKEPRREIVFSAGAPGGEVCVHRRALKLEVLAEHLRQVG